ncbi:MAG TPA: LysR family transcriptional regulator [Candidatus Lachnoclostridium pullistercoris]|uniref:LysR family transcriptional regulator n=1 Tax=Candidatus Lachnoclostridium pullistercoris TaxID=2838632 RepID=A0A9D2PG11_9FIRM|nr:LysR family transcriptional regulator [Candidatus Lachnoclostridium pullistercoris]
MTIRHFRIFIAVASCGSITAAARSLFLTQPTVSVAIRELEEHYGVRFFERISQRLKITEEGTSFLSYASHLISLYDEMETVFQNPDSRGTLRVGASISCGSSTLPALVRRFHDLHPQIRVQAKICPTDRLEELLSDNRLDLAVAGGVIRSPLLKAIPLRPETYVAVCSPSCPLAGRTVSQEEFAAQPLLFRETGSEPLKLLRSAFSQTENRLEPCWESVSQEALTEAARQGLGITILPEAAAGREISQGLLAPVFISGLSLTVPAFLVFHKNKFISPAMEQFLSMTREMIPFSEDGPSASFTPYPPEP